MRANPSSSMQKTYDECFLTCSTAVYFESQNNEHEALRSWRTALDQIYYHNAYRVPANYRPRSETEKALHDSLRQLELQCKERVDLLEALKRSREEAKNGTAPSPFSNQGIPNLEDANNKGTKVKQVSERSGWLGGGTIPPIDYPDLSRPPLPQRPSLQPRTSSGTDSVRGKATADSDAGQAQSSLIVPQKKASRTPSPEKKAGMLKTLRPGGREGGRASSSKLPSSLRSRPPAAAKAATQAWGTTSSSSLGRPMYSQPQMSRESITAARDSASRSSLDRRRHSVDNERSSSVLKGNSNEVNEFQSPFFFQYTEPSASSVHPIQPETKFTAPPSSAGTTSDNVLKSQKLRRNGPPTPPIKYSAGTVPKWASYSSLSLASNPTILPYRNEYPKPPVVAKPTAPLPGSRFGTGLEVDESDDSPVPEQDSTNRTSRGLSRARLTTTNRGSRHPRSALGNGDPSSDIDENISQYPKREKSSMTARANLPPTPTSDTPDSAQSDQDDEEDNEWKKRVKFAMRNLPKGVDGSAAQQILNEIVIHGDEVRWDDVAGLEVAKSALKENVVYPFLRPDLFMGLREPARGMLLFGPPGTGKTMLARAVATESRSTFFAISASSLTSKFLGESEKLVRALFSLAKALAPSIIFVDEIDSLLSSRSGSGEHEATRRIKTEFLIQWSDLAKAAAGREQSDKDRERGDASRVLVLAATNLPWAIDEAARRRFVRRQYIPLPEDYVRRLQLRTLLSHQKHELTDTEMSRLVDLTEGFSGSDITALAKDAAMGPLRSLGEKLLHMSMDEIRPIQFQDFRASLATIRPSVSKQGLKDFEDWATEFGERGG